MPSKEVKWEEVEDGEQIKWEDKKKGFTIEGQLITFEKRMTKKGKGWATEVRTKEGILFFFAPTLLQKKMRTTRVGDIVMINFKGLVESASGGNDYYEFDLKHAEGTKANLESIGLDFYKVEESEEEADKENPDDPPFDD